MAASCEIDNCGVLAVGRCATCSAAFCATHQARTATVVYVDMCTTCQQRQDAESAVRSAAAAAYELEHGEAFVTSGNARKILNEARIATVALHTVSSHWQYRSFGRSRMVHTKQQMGRGWLLGSYRWHYNDGGIRGGSEVDGDLLTVLLDQDKTSYEAYTDRQLAPVMPDLIHGGHTFATTYCSFRSRWTDVAARIHELAEGSGG